MTLLNPDHLLDQATRLTNVARGGAPRQADLRRAISSSYYAVFHSIVTQAADLLVGKSQRHTRRYQLAYRSIDHRSPRDICENVAKPNLPAKYLPYRPRGGFGVDLQAVATAVVELQEKRHLADYDPLYRVTMSDTLLAIATGRRALDRFKNASPTPRNVFLSLVVFSPR